MVLRVGDLAPPLEAVGIDGRTGEQSLYRLEDHRGSTVVLAFYPADRSPVCTSQLLSYTEGIGELDAAGLTLWAISPQNPESHRAFADSHGGFAFPLLSDEDRDIGRRYGILGLLDLYRRSVVIVGPDGRVVHIHRSLGPGLRFQSVERLLSAAR